MAAKRNNGRRRREKRSEAKRARARARHARNVPVTGRTTGRPTAPPIDLIKVHLTAELVLGKRAGRAWAEKQLATLNLRTAMTGLAHLLARRQSPDVTQEQADEEVLNTSTPRLRDVVRRAQGQLPRTVLIGPRACLLAARMALRVCPEEGGVETNGALILILLALQDELQAPDGPEVDDPIDPAHRLGSGRGWSAMRAVAPGLADAVLRRCLDFHRASRRPDVAVAVAEEVWREGCRDPAVAAIHVETTATPSRVPDLAAALAECHEVLAVRCGSTDRAWDHLDLLAANIEGRLARALVPPSSRHAAQNPRRPARVPRFLRVAEASQRL